MANPSVMNSGSLGSAEMAQIVNLVLARVAEGLIAAAPAQRVLMLFCGAGGGYVAGMSAIRALTAANHALTVVLSPAARHVITEARVRQAGATCILGEGWVDSRQLVTESDLVVIPTLSINTAARLALGLMDSLISTLTLGALLAGKPVLAICDGANPFGPGGKVFGGDGAAAPALRARLSANLATLMDFGMDLVNADDFLLRLGRCLGPVGTAPAAAAAQTAPVLAGRAIQSTVVTASDFQGQTYGAVVHLPSGARLTPLAHELSQSLGLRLMFDGV